MLAWDHNAYYHPLLLRQLPAGTARVLEVGCGAGALAVALAGRAAHVDAIDKDPQMIREARSTAPDNLRCLQADVLTHPLARGSYDAIVSMSALHHLPLKKALPRLADALRPGGVLAAVAVPRRDLPREVPVELAASAYHHLLGLVLATGLRPPHVSRQAYTSMPVRSPELTVREVRQQATAVLPGVHVRRLLLWRYLLVWHKPGEGGA